MSSVAALSVGSDFSQAVAAHSATTEIDRSRYGICVVYLLIVVDVWRVYVDNYYDTLTM